MKLKSLIAKEVLENDLDVLALISTVDDLCADECHASSLVPYLADFADDAKPEGLGRNGDAIFELEAVQSRDDQHDKLTSAFIGHML